MCLQARQVQVSVCVSVCVCVCVCVCLCVLVYWWKKTNVMGEDYRTFTAQQHCLLGNLLHDPTGVINTRHHSVAGALHLPSSQHRDTTHTERERGVCRSLCFKQRRAAGGVDKRKRAIQV